MGTLAVAPRFANLLADAIVDVAAVRLQLLTRETNTVARAAPLRVTTAPGTKPFPTTVTSSSSEPAGALPGLRAVIEGAPPASWGKPVSVRNRSETCGKAGKYSDRLPVMTASVASWESASPVLKTARTPSLWRTVTSVLTGRQPAGAPRQLSRTTPKAPLGEESVPNSSGSLVSSAA